MTTKLRTAALAVATLLLASGAALAFLLQDANRFKPRLEALLADQTGMPVAIGGDLRWRLWPPISLRAEALRSEQEDGTWTAEAVTVTADLFEMLREPDGWQIQSLRIDGLLLHQGGNLIEVTQARLEGLAADRPAGLRAALVYSAADRPPLPVQVVGQVRFDPGSSGLELLNTRVDTEVASGTCSARAHPAAAAPAASAADPEPGVLPVAMFRALDWHGDCLLDWVLVDDRRFEQVAVRFANAGGRGTAALEAPQFFGGRAQVDVEVEAAQDPLRWTIAPTLTEVDSGELMAWLDQRLQWAAPLAYGGTLTLEGNSREALVQSLSGETRFDGGQGHINIARIRRQLMSLAALFNEGDQVEAWPEVWAYQRLAGDWRIDRQQHQLELALDNLIMSGNGTYDPASEEINMRVELVFQNDPQWPVFPIHPMLYDLPIPIRCRGALRDPDCRVDGDAAQRIVAQALAGGQDNPLRARMEEAIDTQVPPQYRDAARSLLDLLGGSRQGRSDEPRGD